MGTKELRQRQEKIVAEARERLDLITDTTDEARVKELETSHDTAMAEYDRLEKQIEREEKLSDLERRAEDDRARNRPLGEARGQGVDGGKAPEYRDTFYKMLAAGGDVSELSAEERTVLRGGAAPSEARAQSTLSNAAGAYLVPTELQAKIVKTLAAWGPMYDDDICTAINTTSGNPIDIPTVNDTAVTMGQHTQAAALGDTGAKDATIGKMTLSAYGYDTEFIRFSWELVSDSVLNMENLLADLLGERIARRVNTELTTGDGTGDPQGIVVGSSLGKTAASATAVTADEIIDLCHSVNPAYRTSPKARFMFNDTTLAAIRKLKDSSGMYIWSQGDIVNGVPGTILGHRYSVNQAMASIATGQKTMLFGDFSRYFVRKVGGPVIGVMRERFWPDLGIAGLVRLDGRLADTTAVKHLIQA